MSYTSTISLSRLREYEVLLGFTSRSGFGVVVVFLQVTFTDKAGAFLPLLTWPIAESAIIPVWDRTERSSFDGYRKSAGFGLCGVEISPEPKTTIDKNHSKILNEREHAWPQS
jgi:hypothetical protein